MDTSGRKDVDGLSGAAGASARREHARRKANRERRVRERHPRLGGLVLALSEPPQHESAWVRGAEGEERLARSLDRRLHGGVRCLYDRRIPGHRANIDLIAVAPSGVWVVDAKRYKGTLSVRRPLFGAEKLIVRGRDQTRLVDGVEWQVELVRAALPETPVPVQGALCFDAETDMPIVRTLQVRDVHVLYPRRLARRLNARGPLAPEMVASVAEQLARRFPPA